MEVQHLPYNKKATVLMRFLQTISFIAVCSGVCQAIGFKARIENIPSKVDELFQSKNAWVVNGENYPGRINVDLYNLNNNDDFTSIPAIVDENYSFKYDDLTDGNYELVVNSYDFAFYNNRYRIVVRDDKVFAYEDYLHAKEYNETSEVEISQKPLLLQYRETKQFYEKMGGTLGDMLLNSPFGFIFKNRIYTIIFTILLAILVTPYIINFVYPEFAEQMKEMQAEVAKERLVKKEPSPIKQPPTIKAPTVKGPSASGARVNESTPRKRRG